MTTIFTFGHSTKTIKDFIIILQKYGITNVIDIRTLPRSKTNPQFNSTTLKNSLKPIKIKYEHMAGLGGLRHPSKDSINNGWRNSSFRGYADYALTEEFERNLQKIIELADKEKIVLMCAEILPWRCHRTIIADYLSIRGIEVIHIFNDTNTKVHNIASWAKIDGTKITYPLKKLELVKGETISSDNFTESSE